MSISLICKTTELKRTNNAAIDNRAQNTNERTRTEPDTSDFLMNECKECRQICSYVATMGSSGYLNKTKTACKYMCANIHDECGKREID